MNTPLKKLPLNRETIRDLSGAEMAGVDGGYFLPLISAITLTGPIIFITTGGDTGGGNPQTAGFTNCVYCTNTPTSCGTNAC
ncbi:MAG: hypothetical protein HYY17_12585 [Planctomycetes bacterium]|nr:hypothetical protein [Planctomycetota bacterium]